jgi:hypothetical protein
LLQRLAALDDAGQFSPTAGLGVGDEAGRTLLHQTVQPGLLWAVAIAMDRDASKLPFVDDR